jgi:hypothetical protein
MNCLLRLFHHQHLDGFAARHKFEASLIKFLSHGLPQDKVFIHGCCLSDKTQKRVWFNKCVDSILSGLAPRQNPPLDNHRNNPKQIYPEPMVIDELSAAEK